jgi:crossover junction endodeoxyribonuclease RuvC
MKSTKSLPTPSDFLIAGIDPGYDRMGIAITTGNLVKPELIFSDCVETNRAASFESRLITIGTAARDIFLKFKPGVLSIERLYFSKNVKTAIAVAGARGVILYEAAQLSIPVFEYNPAEVKIAVTGHGKSDKQQVERMVKRLITGKTEGLLDDEFDAIALCLTHAVMAKHQYAQKSHLQII